MNWYVMRIGCSRYSIMLLFTPERIVTMNHHEIARRLESRFSSDWRNAPYALAYELGLLAPDSDESAGYRELKGYFDAARDFILEMVEAGEEPESDWYGQNWSIYQTVEETVTVYTREQWEAFLDLGLYREDVPDTWSGGDLSELAAHVLGGVASSVAGVVLSWAKEQHEEITAEMTEEESEDE